MEVSLLIINSKNFWKLMAFWNNSLSYILKQNAIAKHKNQTLVENARSMWTHVGHSNFEVEAMATSCFVQNRTLILAFNNVTPHEIWYDIKLKVSTF